MNIIQFNDTAKESGVSFNLHNYLHNGRWLIDQDKEGGLYTVGSGTKLMDGLVGDNATSTGVYKVRRTIDPDNAALMCCEITCTATDTSIAVGEYGLVYFPIEASAMTDLRFGTASAEPITIKFKYKTNVLGVYGISVSNSAANRLYLTTFTALTTNEEEATITIPGDITGTWLYTDGTVGLMLRIAFVAGSSYQSSNTNTWQTSVVIATSSQVNFLSANTNIFYLKEIRLVKGRSAGGELTENKAQALARCQRYYEKSYDQGIVPGTASGGPTDGSIYYAVDTASAMGIAGFKVTKAKTPAITVYDALGASGKARNNSNSTNGNAVSIFDITTHSFNRLSGTFTTAHQFTVQWTADARL